MKFRSFAFSVVVFSGLATGANAATPKTLANAGAPSTSSDSETIAAGKYLADAAHCSACHTSQSSKPFAGNVAISSPFGTMYSSNITPDPATGIGNWTEAEFTSALRLGKGRHGEYLYPSMPYTDFTKISDADAHALWIYFRSIRPIAEKAKPNQMEFPFNVRTGIAAWQAAYFRPRRYVDDPSQSAQWNRGAYLVEGLGHCGACHTPKNFAMADAKGHALQGGKVDNWFAPNISGGRYSGIRDWSQDQIATYLKTGHNEKNVAAVGPMMQTIAQGTSKLAASDLQAIAFYLKNQTQENPSVTPKADSMWNDDRRSAGKSVYETHCLTCHGADGKGLDGVAPALAGNTSVTSKGPETVIHAILQGFAPQGRWGVMPSFIETLDAQDISDVTNYVRTAWGTGDGAANATASTVNRMRFDGVTTVPGVSAALICPSAAADELDAATLHEIDGLSKTPSVGTAAATRLVQSYRSRHATVSSSAAVSVLSGAYCRDVMAQASGSYAEKQQRYIEFTSRLSQARPRSH